MRAVLDPNVLVSAVLSRGGKPAALLLAWLDGAYELIVSPKLLDELARVLRYPKIARRVDANEAKELLDLLRAQAEMVSDPTKLYLKSRDPADDYLIALAAAASAVIVTGDSDLHSLADTIPVQTPAAFLVSLQID